MGNFGQKHGEKPGLVEDFKSTACGAFGEDFGELVALALWRNLYYLRRQFSYCDESLGFDFISEACGESDGTHETQFIFGESEAGFADGTNNSCAQIIAAADVVENFPVRRIHQQTIDGEIAAGYVFLRSF